MKAKQFKENKSGSGKTKSNEMTNCHRCRKSKQTTNRKSFCPQAKQKAYW
jgi:hypothetical protein